MNQTTEQRVAAARARMAELKHKFVERSQDDVQSMREGFSALSRLLVVVHDLEVGLGDLLLLRLALRGGAGSGAGVRGGG